MKKIIPVFFLIIVSIILLYYYSASPAENNTVTPPVPSLTPIITPPPPQIDYQGRSFNYYFHKLSPADTLTLIPNFSDHLTSNQIIDKHSCTFGINSGLYRKDNLPLGLFYTSEKKYADAIDSPLFSAFFAQTKTRQYLFYPSKNDLPTDLSQYKFIFQSGPYFDLVNPSVKTFENQQYDRRSLIAVDSTGVYYLFSIYEKDAAFSGPRLADIPGIFTSPDFKKIADFTTVLNLDGGSASSFYDSSQPIKVEELKPIGSFLCGRSTPSSVTP